MMPITPNLKYRRFKIFSHCMRANTHTHLWANLNSFPYPAQVKMPPPLKKCQAKQQTDITVDMGIFTGSQLLLTSQLIRFEKHDSDLHKALKSTVKIVVKLMFAHRFRKTASLFQHNKFIIALINFTKATEGLATWATFLTMLLTTRFFSTQCNLLLTTSQNVSGP